MANNGEATKFNKVLLGQSILETIKKINENFADVATKIDNNDTVTGVADLQTRVEAIESKVGTDADKVAANATAIANEVTARSNADEALSGRITTLETYKTDHEKVAVKYDADTKAKITLGGENGTTIGNVADGTIAEHSKEAVNGGQLYAEQQSRAAAVEGVQNSLNNHIAAYNTQIGNGVKNPYALSVTVGAATAVTYDGSNAVEITVPVDTTLSKSSANAVQNKVVAEKFEAVEDAIKEAKTSLREGLVKVVNELPSTEDANEGVIYLVSSTNDKDAESKYKEFVVVKDAEGKKSFEKLGDLKIVLDDYATKTYTNDELAKKASLTGAAFTGTVTVDGKKLANAEEVDAAKEAAITAAKDYTDTEVAKKDVLKYLEVTLSNPANEGDLVSTTVDAKDLYPTGAVFDANGNVLLVDVKKDGDKITVSSMVGGTVQVLVTTKH